MELSGVAKSDEDTVAIVGMACRLPGDITGPRALWEKLAASRSGWGPFPKERFDPSSFYHPDPERRGKFHVEGSYFLAEDIASFDAPFFNSSAAEATAIDPQQRILMEVVYEALENAGLTLESVSGRDIGVFAAGTPADYRTHVLKDLDNAPKLEGIGNDVALLANRISYAFDLRGPSVTLDTACSASLTALHYGCLSLVKGEASHVIVGGSHLNITPEIFASASTLGVLNASGQTYAFDERAKSGFAKGEGAGALILKRLSDAVKDGDPIRAVIRNTGVNQDGRTAGITSPSGEAQARLFRSVYAQVGLDPRDTPVVEAHGTGTKTGDPIEARAIGETFCEQGRSTYIGSIKTNIGHLEGASGIAAVIKAVLMVEKGFILPNYDFQTPNLSIPFAKWNLVVAQNYVPWPKDAPRRVSINNFGYGGSNAHAIIESTQDFLRSTKEVDRESSSRKSVSAPRGRTPRIRRLFLLSANQKASVRRQVSRLAAHLKDNPQLVSANYMQDLAYTLAQRRSLMQWKAAFSAENLKELVRELDQEDVSVVRSNGKVPDIAFIFTGQGANQPQMGHDLLSRYPVFLEAIERADNELELLGASWSLKKELAKEVKSSQISKSHISQPACTSIQLGLVDLLRSWGIHPTRVTGHSSGEIAAAYAAEVLSFEDCIRVAYYRGLLTARLRDDRPGTRGAMLAAAVSKDKAQAMVENTIDPKAVRVACINSPTSVTFSGDESAIFELMLAAEKDGLRTSKLKVDAAYHSHHMDMIAPEYRSLLRKIKPHVGSKVEFFSSLTGGDLPHTELGPDHWVRNLTSPVQFDDALRAMCLPTASAKFRPDALIEIGPHSALRGPTKQILDSIHHDIATIPEYFPSLQRNSSGVQSLLDLASALLVRGYPVGVSKINNPDHVHRQPLLLKDLPPYSWNHEHRYWPDTRISRNINHLPYPHNDLLGKRLPAPSDLEPVWRNLINVENVPWLTGHKVDGSIVFPAVGYMSMAILAEQQWRASFGLVPTRARLRDVTIQAALVIPPSADVELQLSLKSVPESIKDRTNPWSEFRVHSWQETKGWSLHCQGFVASDSSDHSLDLPIDGGDFLGSTKPEISESWNQVDEKRLYEFLDSRGFSYGPAWQSLRNIKVHEHSKVTARLEVTDTVTEMPFDYESKWPVHPITFDAAILFAMITGGAMEMVEPFVPVHFKSFSMDLNRQSNVGDHLICNSRGHFTGMFAKEFVGQFVGLDPNTSMPVFVADGVTCKAVGSATQDEGLVVPPVFHRIDWSPYLPLLPRHEYKRVLKSTIDSKNWSTLLPKLARSAFYHIEAAVRQVKMTEVELPWLRRLYVWLQEEVEASRTGKVRFQTSEWLEASQEERDLICSKTAQLGPEADLVDRVGRRLPEILRGQADGFEVGMEDQLLMKSYENDAYSISNEFLTSYVSHISCQNPNMKILEVGAGSGAATKAVLRGLEVGSGSRFESYDFTDISPGFLEEAKTNFTKFRSKMNYRVFDAGLDGVEQGFQLESYDLIIASHSLHVTPRIRETLAILRKLLMAGGTLLLQETTVPNVALLPYAVLPGWWLADDEVDNCTYRATCRTDEAMSRENTDDSAGADPYRHDGPLLRKHQWDAVLRDSGFSGLDASMDDFEDVTSMTLLASVAVNEKELEPDAEIVITGPNEATRNLQKALYDAVGLRARSLSLLEAAEAASKDSILIILDHERKPILSRLDSTTFAALQKIIASAKGVFWVAPGMESTFPGSNLALGFGRTIVSEVPDLRWVVFGPAECAGLSSAHTIGLIKDLFLHVFFSSEVPVVCDREFLERDGIVQIPRIVQDEDMYATVQQDLQRQGQQMLSLRDTRKILKLALKDVGALESMYYEELHYGELELPADYVEIKIQACGMNFKDVLIANGQVNGDGLGQECAGIVSRIGAKVTSLAIGDRVCAIAPGSFATHARVPWLHAARLPESVSFAHAATIPIVFGTAYYSLIETARLMEAETVLIHSAAGGLGQAAIKLAKMIGARIFATVSTEDKITLLEEEYGIPRKHIFHSRSTSFGREVLKATGGKGIDVVLNSLTGELLRTSWEALAPCGRFVEVGKRDILANGGLSMAPFEKNISFSSVDLGVVAEERPRLMQKMLLELVKMFDEKKLCPPSPLTILPMADIEQGLRKLAGGKTIGKFAVEIQHDDRVMAKVEVSDTTLLRPDGVYLVIGGTGGIGRGICRLFAANGAKHITLASRSGVSNEEARALMEDLLKQDITVEVAKCDASNASEVDALVRNSSLPIRGVINSAAVFKDGMFENTNVADFNDVLGSKYDGTWNLHNSLSAAGSPLDFFLMLSSVAGVLGNRGQSAYNSANVFLDGFAKYRRRLGLPAAAISLGVVRDIGVLDTEDKIENLSKRVASYPMNEVKVMAIIKAAISGQVERSSRGHIMIGYHQPLVSDQWFIEDPKLSLLMREKADAERGEVGRGQVAVSLRQQLTKAKGREEQKQVVVEAVKEKFSVLLAIPREEIVLSKSVVSYGLDSLVSVELRHWLAREIEASMSVLELLDTPSIAGLVDLIAERSPLIEREV